MYLHRSGDANSYLISVGEMLYAKLLVEPLIELLRNRDYWGYEVFDPDAPLYKQAYQFMRHIFKDQLNPITVAGAKRAAELSGKPFTIGKDAQWYNPPSYDWRGIGQSAAAEGVGLSMLRFGPALSYLEKASYENLIDYYFRRYSEPLLKPKKRRHELDFVEGEVADLRGIETLRRI